VDSRERAACSAPESAASSSSRRRASSIASAAGVECRGGYCRLIKVDCRRAAPRRDLRILEQAERSVGVKRCFEVRPAARSYGGPIETRRVVLGLVPRMERETGEVTLSS
jgi:hypothetical protein